MPKKITKILSFLLCFVLIFQQTGFSQIAGELDISSHFQHLGGLFTQDAFRPLHLRYLSYDALSNNFNLLIDKGDSLKGLSPTSPPKNQWREGTEPEEKFQQEAKTLMNYFFIGLALPNESFWVNLRPDSPNNIIDDELSKTDVGRIFLEADLQLKKDTANYTSPSTPEGKEYWDKLYKKASELYGNENITIPTLTRPWIVPGEIIIRESKDNAYIYKATLKVMLESDYLKSAGDTFHQVSNEAVNRKVSPGVYAFPDQRSKALNEYSTQLIKELIIPKLAREVNSSKRYAPLRQVYYSLILSQWFKQKFPQQQVRNLADLASKQGWDKTAYFNAYKKSFAEGEYNIKEPVYTPTGQVIRSYFSGGLRMLMAPEVLTGPTFSVGDRSYLERVVYRDGVIRRHLTGLSTKPAVTSSPAVDSASARKETIEMDIFDVGKLMFQIDADNISKYGYTKERFRNILHEAIIEATNLLGERLFKGIDTARPVAIAVLDGASFLFENHNKDGFIGIKKELFEGLKSDEELLNIMLKVGIIHELRHEAGIGNSAQDETLLIKDDIRFLVSLLETDLSGIYHKLSGLIGEDFLDGIKKEIEMQDEKAALLSITLNLLYEWFSPQSTMYVENIAGAIAAIAETYPYAITKEIAGKFYSGLDYPNKHYLCRVTCRGIAAIAKHKPELITKDVLDKLVSRQVYSDVMIHGDAAMAIVEIAKSRPELIDIEIVNDLFRGMATFGEKHTAVLIAVAKARPQFIPQIREKILTEIKSQADFRGTAFAFNFITAIAKVDSAFITQEMVNELVKRLDNPSKPIREYAARAIASISAVLPELIGQETKQKLIKKLNLIEHEAVFPYAAVILMNINKPEDASILAKIREQLLTKAAAGDASVPEARGRAVRIIAQLRPDIINQGIADELTLGLGRPESAHSNAEIGRAIKEIAAARPDLITHEMADKLCDRISDQKEFVREAYAKALAEIAKVRPMFVIPKVTAEFMSGLNDQRLFMRESFEKIICEIAAAVPALMPRELFNKFAESGTSGLIRNRDFPVHIAKAVAAMAQAHPEFATQQSAGRLLSSLKENQRDFECVQQIDKALAVIDTFQPAIIRQIKDELAQGLTDPKINNRIASKLGYLLAAIRYPIKKPDSYAKQFSALERNFVLNNNDRILLLTVKAAFLLEGADPGLITSFPGMTEKELSKLIRLIFSYRNNPRDIIELLKSEREIGVLIRTLEDKVLNSLNLNIYEPTRSWNNLEEWLRAYDTAPIEKILLHIIATMKLLQQGVGEQAGFRAAANVEDRLPRVRSILTDILKDVPQVLQRRRLLKAVALGGRDQIDRLRNQAIELVRAATGLQDSRQGLVGNIRDRIHNRPSPQDLPVAKAYLAFAQTGDVSQLAKFDYSPEALDNIPSQRRQATIEAAQNIIVTLEDVYGEGSVASIREYFGRWQALVSEENELKENIRLLLDAPPADNFEFLRKIIEARSGLYALNDKLPAEALLSSINLDNRLEILYYNKFNELNARRGAWDSQSSLRILSNLLENTLFNGYPQEEIRAILLDMRGLEGKAKFEREDWLKVYSIYKRIERLIDGASKSAIEDFQEMVSRIGRAIGTGENIWVENFSSNIFRSDTIYLLSTALSKAKQEAMNNAGISGWQVVVPGNSEGRVRFIKEMSELKNVKGDEIIVVESLPSESPPVTNARAIITLKEDCLLSHPAIRARQYHIPFVVAPNRKSLKVEDGQWASLKVTGEDVSLNAKDKPSENTRQPEHKTASGKITLISPDLSNKNFIIMPDDYSPVLVGNKAFKLNQIQLNLLPGQLNPKHFSLGFNLYSEILKLGDNSDIKAALDSLIKEVNDNPAPDDISGKLNNMRLLIENLTIPDEYLDPIIETAQKIFGKNAMLFLRSSTSAEDLKNYQAAGLYDSFGNIAIDKAEMSKYIKKVWASVWNERAFFDREANAISHKDVMPAVLIQEIINPDYALVIHTQNPSNGSKDEVIIEAVQGLGESLVSGSHEFSGSPYRFTYNRVTKDITLTAFANKSSKLIIQNGAIVRAPASYKDDLISTQEGLKFIKSIAQASLEIENIFGQPQDIEAAIVIKGGACQAAFLQSRDQSNNSASPIFTNIGFPIAISSFASQVQQNFKPKITRLENNSDSPLQKNNEDLGGIDMRYLSKNTVIERDGSLKKISKRFNGHSLYASKELQEIQRLIQAGIIPATKRLEECQGSCSVEALLSCIADILRVEEERNLPAESQLKELLVKLETG